MRWDGQCVEDNPSRLLKDYNDLGNANTPSACMKKCSDKGYTYAGVQYGSQCFCGNTPPPVDTLRPEAQCNRVCPGDSKEKCGGTWRMNVYKAGRLLNREIILWTHCIYTLLDKLVHISDILVKPAKLFLKICLKCCFVLNIFEVYPYSVSQIYSNH